MGRSLIAEPVPTSAANALVSRRGERRATGRGMWQAVVAQLSGGAPMTGLKAWVAALWVLAVLPAWPALARTAHKTHRAHATQSHGCCRAPAGTAVQIELAQPISTQHQK